MIPTGSIAISIAQPTTLIPKTATTKIPRVLQRSESVVVIITAEGGGERQSRISRLIAFEKPAGLCASQKREEKTH